MNIDFNNLPKLHVLQTISENPNDDWILKLRSRFAWDRLDLIIFLISAIHIIYSVKKIRVERWHKTQFTKNVSLGNLDASSLAKSIWGRGIQIWRKKFSRATLGAGYGPDFRHNLGIIAMWVSTHQFLRKKYQGSTRSMI
jgi:hypothetical protein